MNLTERILTVFDGKRPDVMPWFADLTYWYGAVEYRRELPHKYAGTRGRIQLYTDLGCGCHEELFNLPGRLTYYDVKTSQSVEKHKDGTILYEDGYHTPLGSVTALRKFLPSSVSTAYLKYPVSTRQDLKVLQFIHRHQEFEADYGLQQDRLKDWEGLGLVSSLPPRTPFQRLVVVWAGAVNTIRLLMREREEVEETVQAIAESDDPIYEATCESPAPGVYFGENLTSEVTTPTMFKRYYVPYYRRRVAQLHAAKKRIFVHIDGALRGLLPLLGATGVDCAQSVTPAPVGDLPIEKLREIAGPDIILWGGLPGVYFSRQYPEATLLKMAHEVIKHHAEGHRFILGVADQVPPDGEINRVRSITELVERDAKY